MKHSAVILGILALCSALSLAAGLPITRFEKSKMEAVGENGQWFGECLDFARVTLPDGSRLLIGDHLVERSLTSFYIQSGYPVCIGVEDASGTVHALITAGGSGEPLYDLQWTGGQTLEVIKTIQDRAASKKYPVLAQTLTCRLGDCSVSAPRCVLNVPAHIHPEVVKQIEKRRGTIPKDDAAYHDIVEALLLQTLSGDLRAAELLMEHPLNVDGATGETWASAQHLYREAKARGCVGPSE